MITILKKPSAWLPIALPLVVIALGLISVATHGVPHREPDEGTGAHIFQIWLVLEVILIGFFGVKWLPRAPKPALVVLAIQICAALVVLAPVHFLGL